MEHKFYKLIFTSNQVFWLHVRPLNEVIFRLNNAFIVRFEAPWDEWWGNPTGRTSQRNKVTETPRRVDVSLSFVAIVSRSQPYYIAASYD